MDIRDYMGERGLVFRALCQGRVAEVSVNDFETEYPNGCVSKDHRSFEDPV